MLARLHKAMDKDEEGFTLIELLVVIIIIGILAAIAIPVFLSQKSKGYEASMKSDLRTAAQDIESANVDQQDYRNVVWGAKTLGTAAVTDTITGSGTVGSDTVKLSNGNTLDVEAGTTASSFCIKAVNSHTGTNPWYYSTAKGGISTAC